jgi:selenocysteine lyase/cysteine desulfurase
VQHSLRWIDKAHEHGWDVLLDAAAYVPTSNLNLSTHRADFVSLSFYKLFGYPTGIGCLLIHKSKFNKLKKSVFAGGTVSLVANTYSAYFLKPGYEKFESGTLNYLAIPAISLGLDYMRAIGMQNVSQRIKDLSMIILSGFKQLIHDNGLPLIKLYGPKDIKKRGGTFLVNLFDEDGRPFSLHEITKRANNELISLRTGCFCNPGIDELNHGLSADELRNYFTSRDQGAYEDMTRFLNRMRGAVRISVGIPTTGHDLEKFKTFAKSFLNQKAAKTACCPTTL